MLSAEAKLWQITQTEALIITYILREPNLIIVLVFICKYFGLNVTKAMPGAIMWMAKLLFPWILFKDRFASFCCFFEFFRLSSGAISLISTSSGSTNVSFEKAVFSCFWYKPHKLAFSIYVKTSYNCFQYATVDTITPNLGS